MGGRYTNPFGFGWRVRACHRAAKENVIETDR
jgi:hypothetical protein